MGAVTLRPYLHTPVIFQIILLAFVQEEIQNTVNMQKGNGGGAEQVLHFQILGLFLSTEPVISRTAVSQSCSAVGCLLVGFLLVCF